MTEPAVAPPTLPRRVLPTWAIPALALLLSLASVWLSMLALPAMITVVLVAARRAGRARWLVAIVGGGASLGGLMRFTLQWAVPNIVSSGQFAAGERAVSRLREIRWAEGQVHDRGWVDTDGDGRGEYALLGELSQQGRPRSGVRVQVPMLRPTQFHSLVAGTTMVYRSEGYCFTVYLPGVAGVAVAEGATAQSAGGQGVVPTDAAAAARYWVAYAWPAERSRGGLRAFYIDQDDRICETDNLQGYSGADRIPAADAAIATMAGADPCANPTGDAGHWRPWKHKKPRPPSLNP